MDVSTLHTVNESLAELLSELTAGDLRHATPGGAGDVGDLYVLLIDGQISLAQRLCPAAASENSSTTGTSRRALDTSVNLYGGGFEERYRLGARSLEAVFEAVPNSEVSYSVGGVERTTAELYDAQVSQTVLTTWDLALAMGFAYVPTADIAFTVLAALQQPAAEDDEAVWDCALRMSGRSVLNRAVSDHPRAQPGGEFSARRVSNW